MDSLVKGESKGFRHSGMFRHHVNGTVREGEPEVNQVSVRDAYSAGGEMSCQGQQWYVHLVWTVCYC